MIQAILALFTALPEVLKLIKLLQNQATMSLEKGKVKKDLKLIREAFEDQDEQAIKDLFNNMGDPDNDDWVSHVG